MSRFELDNDIIDYDYATHHGTIRWTAMTGLVTRDVINLLLTIDPDVASFDLHINDGHHGYVDGTIVGYRRAGDDWESHTIRRATPYARRA